MRDFDINSPIPAGRVFFPAGIQSFSDQGGFAPASNFTGGSGIVLIGLGRTGEDILSVFFDRLSQYHNEGSPIIRAISITAGDERDRTTLDSNIEHFSFGIAEGTERVQANTDQRRSILGNINKYLEDQFFDFKHNLDTGSDVRCFLIASLSESEVGLIHPILDILAGKRSFLADRAIFLLFSSPHTPALDLQHQYSTIREISHYLQTGVHIPDTHISDKLLERIYFFEGSKNRREDYQRYVSALVETLLTFVSGGASLRRFEAVAQSIEGNHSIRTIGIRNLAVPVLELRDYFASRLIREMWMQTRTLYPASGPMDDDINLKFRAFHNDNTYYKYLEDWLGGEFARWLLNQGSLPPKIEEIDFSLRFIQKMVDFLSDVRLQERYSIAWSGLWFVEGRTAGFPILQNVCRKFRGGLVTFFEAIPDFRDFLDKLTQKNRQVLERTVTGSINRWNTHNLDERVEQIYERLLNKVQSEKIIGQIAQRSGLSAKYADMIWLSPVFIPIPARREFLVSDYIWHEYADYFGRLYETISGFIMSVLMEGGEKIQELDDDSMLYLSEMEQPFAVLEGSVSSENKQGFLLSSNELNTDVIKRRVFKFSSNFVHIPQGNNKSLTALTIFSGLGMDGFKTIRQCAEVYTPDEKAHIDEHLKNTAYFEKQLRKLSTPRAREPFCEPVVMTLFDRNAPIAFFKAFMAGFLSWNPQKAGWRMDAVKTRKQDYLALDLDNSQNSYLTQSIQKESIRSLWEAYRRFAVDIPYRETPDGALQHPLHVNNRSQYLETIISLAKLDDSVEQENRKKWLGKQAEERRDQVELHDFYRLFQAVMRIL
ncbi:MAG: hypothetical protein Q8L68_02300 [Methylococcales bacterium]|nr:hypothetical protein [Methylococcales bacterium]